jgi:hypothetical protein
VANDRIKTGKGKKFRKVNSYTLKHDRVSGILDAITVLTDARKERKAAGQK